jgi:hypothetical protein
MSGTSNTKEKAMDWPTFWQTLQLLMRHESIETTLKYYVDQDADDMAADDVAAELWATAGNTFGNSRQNKAEAVETQALQRQTRSTLNQRRARDSNPQPVTRHDISSVAASHSLTLRKHGNSSTSLLAAARLKAILTANLVIREGCHHDQVTPGRRARLSRWQRMREVVQFNPDRRVTQALLAAASWQGVSGRNAELMENRGAEAVGRAGPAGRIVALRASRAVNIAADVGCPRFFARLFQV